MIRPGDFELAVAELLRHHGFYSNDGWRRHADARAGGAMPPALSAGEAVDERIGEERKETAAAELEVRASRQGRLPRVDGAVCPHCGHDLWRRGTEIVCINIEGCHGAVTLRKGEVAR